MLTIINLHRTFTAVLLIAAGAPMTASAQSIRIQSWNGFGPRFSLSIPLARPSYGYRSAYPYGYGYGYGYHNDYYDYRSDYYNRIYDSYRRDPYSSYFGNGDTRGYGWDQGSAYRPPIAQIEPFGGQPDVFNHVAPYDDAVLGEPARNLPESLRAAANRLSISLSRRRDDRDIWLHYLAPGRIIAAIDQGQVNESMSELLRNYDGVVGNRQLGSIAQSDGFAATRELLRQWVSIKPDAVEPAPAVPRDESSESDGDDLPPQRASL